MTKRAPQPQTITLTIDSLGAGGDGIGTYNNKPVYIAKSAPGDHLTARVTESKDDYKGEVLSIETPSPERIPAPCPHYTTCGGCDLQHINENAYRAWKIAKVKTTLARSGITPKIWGEPIFLPAATRRRTTLALLKTNEKTLILGYHAPRSHKITSINTCLILEPELDNIIQKLRPYLLQLAPSKTPLDITIQNSGGIDVMLTGEWGNFNLAQNEALAAMMNDLSISRIARRKNETTAPEILLARAAIIKTFGALKVNLPPAAFLQASAEGEAALTTIVKHHAQGSKHIADLFCGSGTFTGHLLDLGATVHAVDSDTAAINALKHPKLTTAKRNLFKEPLKQSELSTFDCIVFDPPRAGAKAQTENLVYANTPKIIAVSCNPATFARDAKILLEDGGYTLQSLTIVDQFVWSAHVEIVALFTL
jgi:23S rRNA (uracil1939-C5)-methyltransferase